MVVLIGWLVPAAACAAVAGGCQSDAPAAPRQAKGTAFATATREDVVAARLQAMAAADTYVTVVAQADDELRARTDRPEVAAWALEQRIATAMASYTNATGANGYVALLDMMVLATLKRRAVEEHWIPTLLHEDGGPLLDAYRRGERDVWGLGAKVLSQKQLAELREIIDRWRAENPTQYYVAYIRFTDFANAMQVTSERGKSTIPGGSVFGLLYIDPLAGLDPVARELQEYRAVTERLAYLANRMPIVVSWQVDLAVRRATHDPQVARFVDNTSKFADATERFSTAVAKYPQEFSAERTAAIDQLEAVTTRQVKAALDQGFAGVAEQRAALTRDLEAHENRLDATVDKVRGVVERAGEAGKAINASTGQTVAAAEQSTRRVLSHAFRLAVALIGVTLILLFAYRLGVRRWARVALVTSFIVLASGAGCFYGSRVAGGDQQLMTRTAGADARNATATREMIASIM